MAGIGDGTFETWVRGASRKLDALERAIAKGRVPRYCTSDARPDPGRLAVGSALFETDTNRTIYVNAARSGFVNALGVAL